MKISKSKQEFCESVTRAIPEPDEQVWTNPPTIEQLAADYRNAKDYAERKQQEADAAKADADEKLRVLEIAGEALCLLVSPITAKQEPELVITDWRDLRTGDIVMITGGHSTGWESRKGRELEVRIEGYSVWNVYFGSWCMGDNTDWRFIRRP